MEAALERARASGKLVPAMEGWARELAAQNLALFEGWEDATPVRVNLGPLQLAGRNPPPELLERGRFRGGQERLAVCSQLGLDPSQIG